MADFKPAYQSLVAALEQQLKTNINSGLHSEDAIQRLKIYGPNTVMTQEGKKNLQILIDQFRSPLVYILFFASVLAFTFNELLEGIAIVVVILINGMIGYFMEWQAKVSMKALRKLAKPYCKVKRDKQVREVQVSNLVPGDIIVLEAGDIIPADARLVLESNLAVNESILTGESTMVHKFTEPITKEVNVADQENILFKGTVVNRGRAEAMVFATGTNTELGKIARLTAEAESVSTPLEKRLVKLSQKLIGLTLFLAVIILMIGLLRGNELYFMIETAVALAVAAIPEGLPIVATIALAKGMLLLAKNNVIVKNLSAVETLGETDTIFTDKTGTLTKNEMHADQIGFEYGDMNLSWDSKGKIHPIPFDDTFGFHQLINISALCNDANLGESENQAVGDPLEIALLKLVEGTGTSVDKLRLDYPKIKEIPFDSETKLMATIHKNGTRPDYLVCVKGAPEVILPVCNNILTRETMTRLEEKEKWFDKVDKLASRGLRVLCFAYKEIEQPSEELLQNLTFVAILSFADPPRFGIKDSIQSCKDAGVDVRMVTGDHAHTAMNIGLRCGLITAEEYDKSTSSKVIHQASITKRPYEDLLHSKIFFRVSPAEKLHLVKVFQEHHSIVAMTGDGVNDAPALKQADIGIAMGRKGTDVAKSVADLVLKDDSFSSIAYAIMQGRGIFENIRYFVIYLLSCNLSELLVVAVAFMVNWPSPLLPLQILFINMVTDIFPALALGMNKAPSDIMKRPPRAKNEPILNKSVMRSIWIYSLTIMIAVLFSLWWAVERMELSSLEANNIAFYTLILAQLWHLFNLPKKTNPFFNNEVTNNRFVWLAIILCFIIVLMAYHIPIIRTVLYLQPLDLKLIPYLFVFSIIPVVLVQILKRMNVIE